VCGQASSAWGSTDRLRVRNHEEDNESQHDEDEGDSGVGHRKAGSPMSRQQGGRQAGGAHRPHYTGILPRFAVRNGQRRGGRDGGVRARCPGGWPSVTRPPEGRCGPWSRPATTTRAMPRERTGSRTTRPCSSRPVGTTFGSCRRAGAMRRRGIAARLAFHVLRYGRPSARAFDPRRAGVHQRLVKRILASHLQGLVDLIHGHSILQHRGAVSRSGAGALPAHDPSSLRASVAADFARDRVLGRVTRLASDEGGL
jgi:hypothetical protein